MNAKSIIWGLFFGCLFTGLVFATGIVPTWQTNSVRPIVVTKYDSIHGFIPLHGGSVLSPSWRENEVTPWVDLKYNSLGYFEPR